MVRNPGNSLGMIPRPTLLQTRATDEEIAALDAFCADHLWSRSTAVLQLVRRGLGLPAPYWVIDEERRAAANRPQTKRGANAGR